MLLKTYWLNALKGEPTECKCWPYFSLSNLLLVIMSCFWNFGTEFRLKEKVYTMLEVTKFHSPASILVFPEDTFYRCPRTCHQWCSCLQGLEYAYCISCKWDKTFPPLKKGVLSMILNCNWWWGSSSGVLRNVKYSFLAITSCSTLSWSDSTC